MEIHGFQEVEGQEVLSKMEGGRKWKKGRSTGLKQASDICFVQNVEEHCKLNHQSLDSFDLYTYTADCPWSV